ncbi:acyltransferase family protein [Kineococcus gypseus]|uniref:acyltransferase family protein n=1 Tax=Kineococcus gypseus TaxID=1637102 RepID=UPI003D7E6CA8
MDTARGAALLLVLAYHAVFFSESIGLGSGPWKQLVYTLSVVRMPLFFFLSGTLAVRAIDREWRTLLTGRIGANLWLYVVWATLWYAVFSLVPYERAGAPDGWWRWVTSTFLLPQNAAWYLLGLAAFTALARAVRGVRTGVVLTVAAGVSAVAGTGVVHQHSFVWSNLLSLFVFFAAGSRWAVRTPRLTARVSRPGLAVPLATAVVLVAFVAKEAGAYPFPGVQLLLGAGGVLAGLAVCGWIAASAPGRALAALGSRTLGVYLLHEIVLGVLVLAFTGLDGTALDRVARWVLPVVLVAATLLVAVPSARLLRAVPGALVAPWQRPRPAAA